MFQQFFNWLKNLFSFKAKSKISGNTAQNNIPKIIDDNEIILRGIFSPMFYSKSKKQLKENAFLPPPNSKEVSTLRKNYTTNDFCKNYTLAKIKINGSDYVGFASFFAKIVEETNQEHNPQNEPVYLKYSPLPDLEMHADILYPHIFKKGEAIPQIYKKIAKILCTKVKVYEDHFPEKENWQGEDMIP
jgi:hypothetical protein